MGQFMEFGRIKIGKNCVYLSKLSFKKDVSYVQFRIVLKTGITYWDQEDFQVCNVAQIKKLTPNYFTANVSLFPVK